MRMQVGRCSEPTPTLHHNSEKTTADRVVLVDQHSHPLRQKRRSDPSHKNIFRKKQTLNEPLQDHHTFDRVRLMPGASESSRRKRFWLTKSSAADEPPAITMSVQPRWSIGQGDKDGQLQNACARYPSQNMFWFLFQRQRERLAVQPCDVMTAVFTCCLFQWACSTDTLKKQMVTARTMPASLDMFAGWCMCN